MTDVKVGQEVRIESESSKNDFKTGTVLDVLAKGVLVQIGGKSHWFSKKSVRVMNTEKPNKKGSGPYLLIDFDHNETNVYYALDEINDFLNDIDPIITHPEEDFEIWDMEKKEKIDIKTKFVAEIN